MRKTTIASIFNRYHIYTTKEASIILNRPQITIVKQIERGKREGYKIGKTWLIRLDITEIYGDKTLTTSPID